MEESMIAPANCCLYPALCAATRLESYNLANFVCAPKACAVLTLEIISSASVEAWAYSSIASFAYFVINVPPMPKTSMIAGTMQQRMRANFHCLIKAMTKAEKKDAIAKKPMEI
jgi:bacteriorhodopsin